MWSGPRNISTAMMRSWGSRDDTLVCDEPFYAHYLQTTGFSHHPGYESTLAKHETDWRKVVDWLVGPLPDGKAVFYQKQMAHHLLPHIDRDWIDRLTNCFLIRDPYQMLTSLVEFLPDPTVDDTGLPQQLELFRHASELQTSTPPVLDSHDVLEDPRGMMASLCQVLEIDFQPAMLSWEPGLRETDGAWAADWYSKVAETTGFTKDRPAKRRLPKHLEPLLAECQPMYDELFQHRLVA